MSNTTFADFQANYDNALWIYNESKKVMEAAKKLRDDNCPHTFMLPRDYHQSGNYLDQGYTKRWTECSVCGHQTEPTIKYTGHE